LLLSQVLSFGPVLNEDRSAAYWATDDDQANPDEGRENACQGPSSFRRTNHAKDEISTAAMVVTRSLCALRSVLLAVTRSDRAI
jgi:hypothetical protein